MRDWIRCASKLPLDSIARSSCRFTQFRSDNRKTMKRSSRLIAGVTALLCIHALGVDSLDTWHLRSDPGNAFDNDIRCVAYGNGVFVAAGHVATSSAGALFSSSDGITWTERMTASRQPIWQIVYGNGIFVAVTSSDALTSSDGTNWTLRTLWKDYPVATITFGKGLFLAVGPKGTSWTSPDGINWTRQNVGTNESLFGAASVGGAFFVTGSSGLLITSLDAARWTWCVTGITSTLRDVVYGNGIFIAVGDRGILLKSLDGSNWTNVSFQRDVFKDYYKAAFAGGFFVMVGTYGQIWTSIDGTNWIKRDSHVQTYLTGVTFGKGTFVAVGQDVILQSDPLPSSADTNTTILSLRFYAGIEITGSVGRSYGIEYTDDLAPTNAWKPLAIVQLPSSPYLWFDVASPNIPKRIYRAVLAP